jgi:anti-sigma regulatory factor (Ser/Thr protein kinase)
MARRSGVGEDLLDEVRLAVGEACARAVRRHDRHGVTEPVTVEFMDQDRFSVTVIDVAPAPRAQPAGKTGNGVFDQKVGFSGTELTAWSDPTAESLGLALLGAVVHHLTVVDDPAGPGTRLTMSWPLDR